MVPIPGGCPQCQRFFSTFTIRIFQYILLKRKGMQLSRYSFVHRGNFLSFRVNLSNILYKRSEEIYSVWLKIRSQLDLSLEPLVQGGVILRAFVNSARTAAGPAARSVVCCSLGCVYVFSSRVFRRILQPSQHVAAERSPIFVGQVKFYDYIIIVQTSIGCSNLFFT